MLSDVWYGKEQEPSATENETRGAADSSSCCIFRKAGNTTTFRSTQPTLSTERVLQPRSMHQQISSGKHFTCRNCAFLRAKFLVDNLNDVENAPKVRYSSSMCNFWKVGLFKELFELYHERQISTWTEDGSNRGNEGASGIWLKS